MIGKGTKGTEVLKWHGDTNSFNGSSPAGTGTGLGLPIASHSKHAHLQKERNGTEGMSSDHHKNSTNVVHSAGRRVVSTFLEGNAHVSGSSVRKNSPLHRQSILRDRVLH